MWAPNSEFIAVVAVPLAADALDGAAQITRSRQSVLFIIEAKTRAVFFVSAPLPSAIRGLTATSPTEFHFVVCPPCEKSTATATATDGGGGGGGGAMFAVQWPAVCTQPLHRYVRSLVPPEALASEGTAVPGEASGEEEEEVGEVEVIETEAEGAVEMATDLPVGVDEHGTTGSPLSSSTPSLSMPSSPCSPSSMTWLAFSKNHSPVQLTAAAATAAQPSVAMSSLFPYTYAPLDAYVTQLTAE